MLLCKTLYDTDYIKDVLGAAMLTHLRDSGKTDKTFLLLKFNTFVIYHSERVKCIAPAAAAPPTSSTQSSFIQYNHNKHNSDTWHEKLQIRCFPFLKSFATTPSRILELIVTVICDSNQ